MKTFIKHDVYGDILFEESFWSGKKSITINGEKLTKISKDVYQTADGQTVMLSGNFLKGSSITIGYENITLTPHIKWYEIVLSVLPLILIIVWGNSPALCAVVPVVGGAIGGAISGIIAVLNVLIIKGIKNISLKILISLAAIGIAFAICCGIGFAIVGAMK